MKKTIADLSILLGLFILCGIIGSLVTIIVELSTGASTLDIINQTDHSTSFADRSFMRLSAALSHFIMFLGTGYLYIHFRANKTILSYVDNRALTTAMTILYWGACLFFAYPLVAYLALLNEKLPIPPEWLASQEATFKLIESILKMENIFELLCNVILIGVLPAIGEELVFRGIIQKKLERGLDNPHLAIVIAAFLFAIIHGQLERVIPLMFIGCILGYSYYYSRSFWVPVILHFMNNTIQVLVVYIIGDVDAIPMEDPPPPSFIMLFISVILTLAAGYLAMKQTKRLNE